MVMKHGIVSQCYVRLFAPGAGAKGGEGGSVAHGLCLSHFAMCDVCEAAEQTFLSIPGGALQHNLSSISSSHK